MKKTLNIKRHVRVSNTMPQEEYKGILGTTKRNSYVPSVDYHGRHSNQRSLAVSVSTLAIAAAVIGTGVHVVMGTGGAPEGVLTAAALRCLNGEILARLVPKDAAQAARLQSMGIRDHRKVYTTEELAPGREIIFAATGVTEGSLLKGVRFFGDGVRVHSLVMTLATRTVRFIDSVHLSKRPDVKVRF